MTNTPSSRSQPPEPDFDEATVVDFGQSRAQADPEETDGQETMIWDGTAQLAALEAEIAQGDGPTMVISEDLVAAAQSLRSDALPLPESDSRPLPERDAPVLDPRVWFLGRSFGGFRVVCELASGGMATVFLARKEGPARVSQHAAIKVVHPHLINERDFVHMFLDEARIAACLDHPNVCRVLDFGEAEGTYYLAMEYLLGETWSAVRLALGLHPEAHTLLPAFAAHVLAQACEGLHAAHEACDDQGRPLHVVHRDVSPQNIFVAYDGTVRVLDFGVASAADRITSTRDGILKGRLAYMSPEQMAGEPVGRAADVWAMGVVLRESLEGKRLFRRASDAETMFAVSSEPLPPWSVEVPERLREIVERALTRDPAARYATAHEMALELTRFAATQRGVVSTAALSAWMYDHFALQIEQKRALLQLPLPTPREAPSPWSGLPRDVSTERVQTSEAAFASTVAPARRRSAFQFPPALVALGCLGIFTGVVLGRVLRNTDKHAPAAQQQTSAAPNDEAAPTAPTAPPAADLAIHPDAPPQPHVESLAAPAQPDHAEAPARADQEEASEAARATGTLVVAFEGGWAEVYLGTKLLGTTPGHFELPEGQHTLTIKPFGAEASFKRRVSVQPTATTKLFLSATEQ